MARFLGNRRRPKPHANVGAAIPSAQAEMDALARGDTEKEAARRAARDWLRDRDDSNAMDFEGEFGEEYDDGLSAS